MKKPKTYKPNLHRSSRVTKPKEKRLEYSKLYNSDWNKYRFRFLHHNPKCYACGEKSQVVDHVYTHKGDVEKFQDTGNHIPLCSRCHNYITGKFDRLKIQDIDGKNKFLQETRKQFDTEIRVKKLELYIKGKK